MTRYGISHSFRCGREHVSTFKGLGRIMSDKRFMKMEGQLAKLTYIAMAHESMTL